MENPVSQSSSVSGTTFRQWSIKEINKASKLWLDGKTTEEIAEALGRGVQSIKHVARQNRPLFPRRNQSHSGGGPRLQVKFSLTRYMYQVLQKEAAERKVSMSVVINEALRHELISKKNKRAR